MGPAFDDDDVSAVRGPLPNKANDRGTVATACSLDGLTDSVVELPPQVEDTEVKIAPQPLIAPCPIGPEGPLDAPGNAGPGFPGPAPRLQLRIPGPMTDLSFGSAPSHARSLHLVQEPVGFC